MAEWVETYRGIVNAWECDVVEHFTIAYYFERFADATRNLLDLVGEGETLGSAVGADKSRLYTTFTRELRAGAGFHMLSSVVPSTTARCDWAIGWSTRRATKRSHGSWKAFRYRPRRRRSCVAGSRRVRPRGRDPRCLRRWLTDRPRGRSRGATASRRGISVRAGRCRPPPRSIGSRRPACSSSRRSA